MKYLLILTTILVISCTKTVTRTERLVVTNTDTLNLLVRDTINNWPKPNDSSIIFLAFDTIPGFVLDSIVIQDINTDSVYNAQIEYHINGYIIRPLTPMYVCITFYYQWQEPNNLTISMSTFEYTDAWILYPKNLAPHDGIHYSENTFRFVDISKVFTITFTNH